mmetsp:Transcript_11684/g.17701  ORF Transcript_11684/g.17701 Transcript_11684/m.17701 type:complete len:461 (-) Transcript_11684:88-1470(-)
MTTSKEKAMRVAVIHLDLGIGGAERLVVNIACAMQDLGHTVQVYTSHHDPNRCFEETKTGGALHGKIYVMGDWIPRQIFGMFTALCAIMRMFYLAFGVCCSEDRPDIVFIDGVSMPIPILQYFGIPVLFYCHFPDKLLCTQRKSFLKRAYRLPIDVLEETTTGCADTILVNSKFTAETFMEEFNVLGRWCEPKVLYPSIEDPSTHNQDKKLSTSNRDSVSYIQPYEYVFTSLNRYERKKNVYLAIDSFKLLLESKSSRDSSSVLSAVLVIAGGYDSRVKENVEYFEELVKHVQDCGIEKNVVFRRSIDDEERDQLLTHSTAILYTPSNEHFGIVPIEAMCAGTPVIAVSSGGPKESIEHNVTGFLCSESPDDFMSAMLQLVQSSSLRTEMSANGIDRITRKFSNTAMRKQLQTYLVDTVRREEGKRALYFLHRFNAFVLGTCIVVVAIVVGFVYRQKSVV